MVMDRRKTDSASHAHKRESDADNFARLHQRIDDNDKLLSELLAARAESVRLHTETTTAVNQLAFSVGSLTDAMAGMAGMREMESDVRGMMRLMSRLSGFVGVLWKPLLFIAVLGGMLWIWITGGKLP
jgi:hypothetical protein